MTKDGWILIGVAVAAYWFLFRRTEMERIRAVPVNPGYNPVQGKTQEAGNDVFSDILGLVTAGVNLAGSIVDQAQSSSQRN